MPAKTVASKAQSELVPKLTNTVSCRLDINQNRKLVLYTKYAALVVLGFSDVPQVAEQEFILDGQKFEVHVL
jgi:hypothetical protein